MFLQREDPKLHRETLLRACFTDDRFEAEDSRAGYLWELIQITGDAEYYRDAIRQHLPECEIQQVFELAARFAAHGDALMKHAMYGAFEQYGCAEELIKLDGMPALVRAAAELAPRIEDDWQATRLIDALYERDGPQPLPLAVKPLVRPDRPWSAPEPVPIEMPSVEDAKLFRRWARQYWRKAYAGPIEPLLDLVRERRAPVSRAAAGVLEPIRDPRIRELGLELLDHPEYADLGPDLLKNNPGPGDFGRFERLLASPESGIDRHWLVMGIGNYCSANLPREAEPCLLLSYAESPCPLCRNTIVHHLVALGRFPGWMREECLHDAYPGTREAAQTSPPLQTNPKSTEILEMQLPKIEIL